MDGGGGGGATFVTRSQDGLFDAHDDQSEDMTLESMLMGTAVGSWPLVNGDGNAANTSELYVCCGGGGGGAAAATGVETTSNVVEFSRNDLMILLSF